MVQGFQHVVGAAFAFATSIKQTIASSKLMVGAAYLSNANRNRIAREEQYSKARAFDSCFEQLFY